MNTRLNIFTMTSVAMLLGLASTSSALAQEHTPDFPAPQQGDRVSCENVEWHRDMLGNNPWVSGACHEAIVIDGQTWARFEAEFQEYNRNDGTFTANFRNESGRSMGTVSLEPAPGQRVSLDGRPTQFSALRRGQVLNFYSPENANSFTTNPGASDEEMVKIAEPRQDENSTRMAEANRNENERPDTLPATAGPLPIIALGGMFSLLGGLGLTTRRRLKKSNA